MKITATYSDTQQQGSKAYPWCGIGKDGQIVLFHAHRSGTMLRAPIFNSQHSAYHRPIGNYADCWNEEHFTPWTGKIELIITGA